MSNRRTLGFFLTTLFAVFVAGCSIYAADNNTYRPLQVADTGIWGDATDNGNGLVVATYKASGEATIAGVSVFFSANEAAGIDSPIWYFGTGRWQGSRAQISMTSPTVVAGVVQGPEVGTLFVEAGENDKLTVVFRADGIVKEWSVYKLTPDTAPIVRCPLVDFSPPAPGCEP